MSGAGNEGSANTISSTGTSSTVIQRFEEQWSDPHRKRPRLEDYLNSAPAEQRADLLTKLLSIEVPARSNLRNADLPTVSEYVGRFPQYETEINQAFEDWPLDNYVLLAKLGQGGMGKVYKARRCLMHDLVAVKLISEDRLDSVQDGQSKFDRFRREIRTIGQLVHPNIVRALDARRLRDGQLILVMELIDGDSLTKLASDGRLSLGAACEAVRQAALAVDFAHTRGIIHRDIKSENLMATWDGVIKLLDLGLAKVKAGSTVDDTALTQTLGLLGTPEFMAPEQWQAASEVDARADVYALGCVLYQLLVGIVPWPSKSFRVEGGINYAAMQKAVCESTPKRVDERVPNCPPELADLVAQAMHRDPQQRLGSAAGLAARLEQWASLAELRQCLAARKVCPTDPTKVIPESKCDTAENAKGSAPPPAASISEKRSGVSTTPLSSFSGMGRRISRRTALAAGGAFGCFGLAIVGGWYLLQPSAARRRAEWELATLPGLRGEWWFVEMPWYTPAVRKALLASMSTSELLALEQSLLKADTAESLEIEAQLIARSHDVAKGLPPVHQNFVKFWIRNDMDKLSVEKVSHKFRETLAELKEQPNRTAEDWHLGAVLLHRLAYLQQEGGDYREARNWYEEAIAAYGESQPEWQWLATTDQGTSLLHAGDIYSAEAAMVYGDLVDSSLETGPQLAKTWVEASLSEAYSTTDVQRSVQHARAALDRAKESLGEEHSLRAFALKSLAWRYVDSLQFETATVCFQSAGKILPKDEPKVAAAVFHLRHGEALCKYFIGEDEKATRLLNSLIKDIRAALLPSSGIEGTARELVMRRLPNSLERLADCHLFGKADYTRAASIYEEAMTEEEKLGATSGANAELYASLWLRRILALTCGNDSSAGLEWESLQTWTATAFPPERPIDKVAPLIVIRKASEALRTAAEPEKREAGLAELQKLITSPTLARDDQGTSVRRDDLGPMLLAAEQWFTLTSDFNTKNASEAAAVLRSLLDLHASAVANSADFTWFFQRCFDKAQERLQAAAEYSHPAFDPVKRLLDQAAGARG